MGALLYIDDSDFQGYNVIIRQTVGFHKEERIMEKFMRKYSVWLTAALGAAALIYLIVSWKTAPILQKVICFYMIALACHEFEELKFPGGFVELVTGLTGIHIGNLGVAKFILFLFTIYATVIPLFIYRFTWPAMALILVGYVEALLHLAAARINKERFYSPGMITALVLQLPVSVFGTWYLFSNHLVRGIYWLWAILYLFVPLLVGQAVIVKSNGMKYRDFIGSAGKNLLHKK